MAKPKKMSLASQSIMRKLFTDAAAYPDIVSNEKAGKTLQQALVVRSAVLKISMSFPSFATAGTLSKDFSAEVSERIVTQTQDPSTQNLTSSTGSFGSPGCSADRTRASSWTFDCKVKALSSMCLPDSIDLIICKLSVLRYRRCLKIIATWSITRCIAKKAIFFIGVEIFACWMNYLLGSFLRLGRKSILNVS